MQSRIRYLLTIPLATGLLGLAVVGTARAAWWLNPVAPPGVLVAPDCCVPAGSHGWAYVNLVGGPGVPTAGAVIFSCRPDGRSYWEQAGPRGSWCEWVGPYPPTGERMLIRHVQFRLSPESGFGPLETFGRIFVLDLATPSAAVDLEGIRRFSRYELGSGRRDWLIAQLQGRMPIYLADVSLRGYEELRASLQSAGWPDGPLVMWRRRTSGAAARPEGAARSLLKWSGLDLAVLSDIPDNRRAFRHRGANQVRLIDWPIEGDRDGPGAAD